MTVQPMPHRVWCGAAAGTAIALSLLLAGCNGVADAESGEPMASGTAPVASGTMIPVAADAPKAHTIVDPIGQDGATAALDVTPPPGWRVESAIRRDNVNGQCSLGMISPMFRMTSPDGRSSIEMLPGFLVTTSEQDIRRRGSTPGDFCIVAMAESGEALAQRIAIPFLRPQARIEAIRQVPLAPEIAAMSARFEQLRQVGNMRIAAYGIEARLAYPDDSVETITLGGIVTAGQQLMPGVPPLVLNQNLIAYAVRAPADQLVQTEALAAKVRSSIRFRPDWKRNVEAYQNRMTKPVFAQPGTGSGPSPSGGGGGGAGGGGGEDWIDRTARAQRRMDGINDEAQRQRIETIRDEQRCLLTDGTTVVQSIHTPCPN